MVSTFLDLTNRVLNALNEVVLTSVTFPNATGFHAQAQEAIRQAVFDVYTYQDTEWPFLWTSYTFGTTAGTTEYTKDTNAASIDWDSFKIQRLQSNISSLTQVGGLATAITSSPHKFLTNDEVFISGANETDYNSTTPVVITVLNSTTFTFAVSSTATSPATGTIIVKSNTVLQRKLFEMGYDKYRQDFWDQDLNANPTEFTTPSAIARKTDNNIIVTPTPDRDYTIYYEGFQIPAALTLEGDTCLVPEEFEQVVIDKAMHYAYMFRDNLEQAQLVAERYKDNINKMRRILIPQDAFARFSY